jgi:hypothetical protein
MGLLVLEYAALKFMIAAEYSRYSCCSQYSKFESICVFKRFGRADENMPQTTDQGSHIVETIYLSRERKREI